MKTYHLIAAQLDDAHAYELSYRHMQADPHHTMTLQYREDELLRRDGSHEAVRDYIEGLADLRKFIDHVTADRSARIVVDLGYNLTGLFAAYYAVLNSPHVDVRLMTLPAFGGDTMYARTHPLLIQKMIYNVLLKAQSILSPIFNGEEIMRETYPRLERAFVIDPLPLPDTYLPTYDYVRDGVAIFTEFEPGAGIDRALAALSKVARVRPALMERSVTILGAGDIQQASNISAAFPNWKVLFNPPLREYVTAAAKAEVVILPDEPPHAGPTRELFAAIGAGAAIVAHTDSAAAAYAGKGAVTFETDGDGVLRLANAILKASADPAITFGLMAATVERRNALRNDFPTLVPAPGLVSTQTEATG